MLVMSVVHEWDGGKMVILAFVTFKDGKAIEMISSKGDPALITNSILKHI